ncbi:MAG: DUF4093 domain-containing protein [Oscillospiraceae bacterium]|nr:DUF4093 domain-containing protein [Oscillospiraceae bacterium]
MLDKIKVKQAVVVEGRYDRAVLESVIDAVIFPVNGFGVYKDKKKLALIRRYAETTGVILLTDSDNAGRQIRDYLKSTLKGCTVEHLYVPNLLEVEDTAVEVLRNLFEPFGSRRAEGVSPPVSRADIPRITRERLFDDGFIGGVDSAKKRKALLALMNLPENLSVTSLLEVLNKCGSEEYEKFILQ